MRRRFGRRRGGNGADEARGSLDVARILEKLAASAALGVRDLEALDVEGLPPGLAVVASAEADDGRVLVVAAPREAGDALLAALAAIGSAEEAAAYRAGVVVVAPSWPLPARRRLSLVGDVPFVLRAIELPELAGGTLAVAPEPLDESPWLARDQLAAHLAEPAERELAERALEGLAGLGAKHGGTTRVHGRSLELVLVARRVAAVRIDDDGVLLDTILPQRRSERLSAESLGDAFDRLEGGLRKRVHDRDVREGEEGLRARAVGPLGALLGLRNLVPWPRGGADVEAVDLLGIDAGGHPVVGALRERLGLVGLGAALDALVALRPALPALLVAAAAPLRFETPRLVLAAAEFEPIVERVLRWFAISTTQVEVRQVAGRDAELVLGGTIVSANPLRRTSPPPARPEADDRSRERSDSRRGRGGRERPEGERNARGPRGESGPAPDRTAREREAARPEAAASGFEEVSLFDLDVAEESPTEEGARDEAGRSRRGRRRRRGRGRGRVRSESGEASAEDARPEPGDAEERAPRAVSERSEDEALDDDDHDLVDEIVVLSPDAPEFIEEPAPAYEEDDEEADDADPEAERMHRERALRRRARVAKAAPPIPVEAPAPKPQRPKRIAILAHADRDSVAAAVLLARDVRLLEGIWVYPQADLMTFFRGVATDLREETPIHVIGFAASPARDVIQAAALYRDRLVWYDHHSWPPEDIERLKAAIGGDAVFVTPGTRSSLPAVLAQCGRRSRFSDKLVDLVCARFTQHDFERWGRVWWSRLASVASRPGERRADLEPLLAGRPSDLAREAAAAQTPEPPAEVSYVAERDFRLVHFGGLSLVVVPVPPELDVHLAARVARERYGAALSLAFHEGDDLLVLCADEQTGRRSLDVLAMSEHLAAKHDWIEAMPEADHVARIPVRRLALHPERLDEVLADIATGRSILDG